MTLPWRVEVCLPAEVEQAEPDMHQFGADPQLARQRKHLPEMQLLAFVGDIDDGGRIEFLQCACDRGYIGGRVIECAVRLAHDAGRQFIAVKKGHQRPFAFAGQPVDSRRSMTPGRRSAVMALAARQVEG